MVCMRTYESWEVRDLLRRAEGAPSPVSSAFAHSRSLHAGSIRGGQGISRTNLQARVNTNAQQRTPLMSSMFPNLILQGLAATQALNSTGGQQALQVFDDAQHSNENLRMTLQVSGIVEADFVPGATAPSVIYTVRGSNPQLQTAPTTGVKLIIDRPSGGTEIFIQTCFPLHQPCQTQWSVNNFNTRTLIRSG